MSRMGEVNFTLKVLMNKEKTKLLFAEIDNDLADVLLSFLTLPLGTLVRLLKKHYGDKTPVIGSLNTLYDGIKDLKNSYFSIDNAKLMLLNSRSLQQADCSELKLKIDDTPPIKYFTCNSCNNVCVYHPNAICECGGEMKDEIFVKENESDGDKAKSDHGGVFTRKLVSFLLTDDLQLLTGSIMQNIGTLGLIDSDGAEQSSMTLGFNEIMDLLKGSLISRTPLTNLILHKPHTQQSGTTVKTEPPTSPSKTKIEESSSSIISRISIKVMLQKSTKKFLFAQVEQDFVNFLFTFLTIPLGKVESLLDGNSSLGSIDNFYKSVENLNSDKHLKSNLTKDMLLKPKLPPHYLSRNQFFSLDKESTTPLFYKESKKNETDYLSLCGLRSYGYRTLRASIVGPNMSYVKDGGTFMVTDDLTVTPLLMLSSLSKLKELKIPLSDIDELEMSIGLEEGLSILKASLTSTSALTKGLNLFLGKQPKLED